MKRTMSILLVVIMLITNLTPVLNVYGAESVNSDIVDDISVRGENSFGNMLAAEINTELESQNTNTGYSINNIEIVGNMAQVSFSVVKDATLVVALYDDTGIDLLATGTCEVKQSEHEVSVAIDAETMPQYFYLKGYIVDAESLRLLSAVYESPMYTQDVQEFMAKTTDDFAADRVLNLDDDKTNNFAVYSEETIVISEVAGTNEVVTADIDNNQYVLENVDEQITTLKAGDIFSYRYSESEMIIIQVDTISVDGTTATITGKDVALEDAFDYVKIVEQMSMADAIIDESAMGEGVTLVGTSTVSEYTESMEGVEVGYEGAGLGAEFSISNDIVKGTLGLSLAPSFDYIVTLDTQYIRLAVDYEGTFGVEISVDGERAIPITVLGFSPVVGVYIEVKPALVLAASFALSFNASLTGVAGICYADGALYNISSVYNFESDVKAEGSVAAGLNLGMHAGVIGGHLASAEVSPLIVGKVTVTDAVDLYSARDTSRHACVKCLDGETAVAASISAEVELFNNENLKAEIEIAGFEEKTGEFYYSVDMGKGGLGDCPYVEYRVDILVTDTKGQKMPGVYVGNHQSDVNGKILVYLKDGTYNWAVSKEGYCLANGKSAVEIEVDDAPEKVNLVMCEGNVVIGNNVKGIPDKNFYNAMLGIADVNKDGVLTTGEALKGTRLSLSYKGIGDVTGIRFFKNLTSLSINNNKIKDITEIGELTNLQSLNIGYNFIDNIGTLKKLTKLVTLDCPNNNITDISVLESLTKLEILSLCNNNISDISALENLTKLVDLRIFGNNISDVNALKNLLQLDTLYLDDNKISDVSPLGNLTKLRTLDLSENNISDISSLEKLVNLELLYARSNDISDISVVRNFTELWALSIAFNPKITDFSPVENLTKLSYFVHTGCGVSTSATDESIESEMSEVSTEDVEYTGSGLTPNVPYIFYIFKSYELENILLDENILYIGNGVADAEGNFSVTYNMKEEYENPVMVAVSMYGYDVGASSVELNNLTYTGEEQFATPVVTYGSKILTEGLHYELSGDYRVIEAGSYSLTITGIGDYSGSKTVPFEVQEVNVDPVEAFVERMYTVALNRSSDEEGKNNWVYMLNAGTHDGAGIAEEFILGEEFELRGLTDEQYVDVLYTTFFNRDADEDGKNLWIAVLASGQSREYVLSNFVNLAEFTLLCEGYGIERGVMLENGTAVNPGIPKFVKRLYTNALGRDAENEGLYNNVLALVVKAETAESAAKNFFGSEEYALKGNDSEAYVSDLYVVFMDREADADGLAFWVECMDVHGMTKEQVISEFASSDEFGIITANYGLE